MKVYIIVDCVSKSFISFCDFVSYICRLVNVLNISRYASLVSKEVGVPLVKPDKCNDNFLDILELSFQQITCLIAIHTNVSKHTIDFPSLTSNPWYGADKEESVLVTLTKSK